MKKPSIKSLFSNRVTTAPRARVPLPMRRSAEFWTDVFVSTLETFVEAAGESPLHPENAAHRARLVADAALKEYEERWPGVGL